MGQERESPGQKRRWREVKTGLKKNRKKRNKHSTKRVKALQAASSVLCCCPRTKRAWEVEWKVRLTKRRRKKEKRIRQLPARLCFCSWQEFFSRWRDSNQKLVAMCANVNVTTTSASCLVLSLTTLLETEVPRGKDNPATTHGRRRL